MPKMPLTKIVFTIPSPDVAMDIWKLFDYIVVKMEELGRNGMPLVDAQDRKRFRAECMRAPDGTLYDVFTRWVTILIPKFVPATAELLRQQSTRTWEVLAKDAEEAAKVIEKENAVGGLDAAKKEAQRKRQAEILAKARAAKKHPPKVKEPAPLSKVEKAMLAAAEKVEGETKGDSDAAE